MFQVSTADTLAAVKSLRGFIPVAQIDAMITFCRGEEGNFFRSKFIEYAERVATMPKTYNQDGKGDDAIAYLHYFSGNCDWYITEKDMETEQNQAFGYVDIGYGGELGYISLAELCLIRGVELDLHFAPTTLREIKLGKSA